MPGSRDWTFLGVCHHVRLDAEGTWVASIPILPCRDGFQCRGFQGLERLPHGLHCSPQKVWMAYSGTGESLLSFPTTISKIFQWNMKYMKCAGFFDKLSEKDHGVRSCQACPCGYSWEHGSKRDQDSQGLWFCQACVQNIWVYRVQDILCIAYWSHTLITCLLRWISRQFKSASLV